MKIVAINEQPNEMVTLEVQFSEEEIQLLLQFAVTELFKKLIEKETNND